MEALIAYFNFVDDDADGSVSREEIKKALLDDLTQEGIIAEPELIYGQMWFQKHFDAVDYDDNGRVTVAELQRYLTDA